MKWLRVEFLRECFDAAFFHEVGSGRELLADVEIFQI
jgi:hypothetical protein